MDVLGSTAVVLDMPHSICTIGAHIATHIATTAASASTHTIACVAATGAHAEQMLQEFGVRLVFNLSEVLIVDLFNCLLELLDLDSVGGHHLERGHAEAYERNFHFYLY